MIVRFLGLVDVVSAIALLAVLFGMSLPLWLSLLCAAFLFLKGLFIFSGNFLSAIDLASSFIFILSIFFAIPSLWLWMPACLLLAKGIASFI